MSTHNNHGLDSDDIRMSQIRININVMVWSKKKKIILLIHNFLSQ